MAYNKIVTSDVVVQRCIETQGIYKRGNSAYNSLVDPGATSVRRPKLPQLVCKTNSGTAMDSPDRKKTGEDTSMITTDLNTYAVPISSEIANQFATNRKLLNDFAVSAGLTVSRQWDRDFIAAAKKTQNYLQTLAAGTVGWEDLMNISAKFTELEVPKSDMILVVSSQLETKVKAIDVIKQAAAFSILRLQSGGKLIQLTEFDLYFSNQVGLSKNGKPCIVGIYGPGIASITPNQSATMKEAWDGDKLKDHIDFVTYAAFESDGDEFSVVLELK